MHGVAKSHSNDAALLGTCRGIINLPAPIVYQAIGHARRQRRMPDRCGTPRGRDWPAYCRAKNNGAAWHGPVPGHKSRQARFPDRHGVASGDLVGICNRKGRHAGYAMIYHNGARITLAGTKPAVTGKTDTARILARNHGYQRQTNTG